MKPNSSSNCASTVASFFCRTDRRYSIILENELEKEGSGTEDVVVVVVVVVV